MFVCPIAAKAPSTIEPSETRMMICCHCAAQLAKGPGQHARHQREAATLGAAAKKAVTGVGAPS